MELEYSTIKSGEIIHAGNFVNTVFSSIDNLTKAGPHTIRPDTGKEINGNNDSGSADPLFKSSDQDVWDAKQLGFPYSVSYLALITHAGFNANIKDQTSDNSISKRYGVEKGKVVAVAGAAKYVLSAFAFASCYRQAFYEVFFKNENGYLDKTQYYTYSFLNNDHEAQRNASDGKPMITQASGHISLVSSDCVTYYRNKYGKSSDEAKKSLWFNWAGDKDAEWKNYPPDFSNKKISSITEIDRSVSGQVNIYNLRDYGWNPGYGFNNVVVNGKHLSDIIRNKDVYTAGNIAAGQTLSVGNIISAKSMNDLLHYLEDFNWHIASAYYTVFTGGYNLRQSDIYWCQYVIEEKYAVDGQYHSTEAYFLYSGGNLKVQAASEFNKLSAVSTKRPFVCWEVIPNVRNVAAARPGDVIRNVNHNFRLYFRDVEPEQPIGNDSDPVPGTLPAPNTLAGAFSWGYYGTSGCKFGGRSIGDDLTEYSKLFYDKKGRLDRGRTRVASNLADGPSGYSARIPITNQLAGGNCYAYIKWQNNAQFDSGRSSQGILQRWATFDLNLGNLGVKNASSYKYFTIQSLSASFNENEPTHSYAIVYLVDLNSVDTYDSGYGQIKYIPNYYNTGVDGHYGYYLGSVWDNATGGTPFRKKGTNNYICPFAITKRYHVYPILTYCVAWCPSHGWGPYFASGRVSDPVYHDLAATYLDLDKMKRSSYFSQRSALSVSSSQKCVRSLCQCQSPNSTTFDGTDLNKPYPRGSQDTTVTTVDGLPMGCFGINNRHSENIFFKIVNGHIKVAIYISRVIDGTGGADQSFGEIITGTATNKYPGYNEELTERGIVPEYFQGEG